MQAKISVIIGVMIALNAHSHNSHNPEHQKEGDVKKTEASGGKANKTVAGQGEWKFRYRPDLSEVPVNDEILRQAHGGFAVDRSKDKQTAVFGLPGAGLFHVGEDLRVEKMHTDSRIVKDGGNYHNATYFTGGNEQMLSLPSNDGGRVWILDESGELQTELVAPDDSDGFAPTDTEFVGGRLFVANGYADRVIYTADPFRGAWESHRWGGKGPKKLLGRFSTSHGVTRFPGTDLLTVSDREYSRLQTFTGDGTVVGAVSLPQGSKPCDIDYYDATGKFAVVGCLVGPKGQTPAPFYILENGNIVSKVNPGRDFGVPNSTHIHNAAFLRTKENGASKDFVLVLFWNPGGYAVFERVDPS